MTDLTTSLPTNDFDLDREVATLPSWSAHGSIIATYRGTTGTPVPPCTAENPCLREGWVTFGGEDAKPTYEYVQYAVSGHSREVVDGLDNPFYARLIASAPDLLRFVKSIADGDALAMRVVDDAKELLESLRIPVHVPGRTDYTNGPYDPSEYGSRWDSWVASDDDDE